MFFPNGLYNRFKNHDRIVTEDFELNAPRMIFHSDVFIYQRSIAEWLIWRFDGWIIPAALPRAGVLWFWVGVNFSGVVSVLWLLFTQSPSVKTLKQTAPGSHSLNLHYVPHPEGGACESECVFDSKVSLQRQLLLWSCSKVFVSRFFKQVQEIEGYWFCSNWYCGNIKSFSTLLCALFECNYLR